VHFTYINLFDISKSYSAILKSVLINDWIRKLSLPVDIQDSRGNSLSLTCNKTKRFLLLLYLSYTSTSTALRLTSQINIFHFLSKPCLFLLPSRFSKQPRPFLGFWQIRFSTWSFKSSTLTFILLYYFSTCLHTKTLTPLSTTANRNLWLHRPWYPCDSHNDPITFADVLLTSSPAITR
jgi:hypothetical protein